MHSLLYTFLAETDPFSLVFFFFFHVRVQQCTWVPPPIWLQQQCSRSGACKKGWHVHLYTRLAGQVENFNTNTHINVSFPILHKPISLNWYWSSSCTCSNSARTHFYEKTNFDVHKNCKTRKLQLPKGCLFEGEDILQIPHLVTIFINSTSLCQSYITSFSAQAVTSLSIQSNSYPSLELNYNQQTQKLLSSYSRSQSPYNFQSKFNTSNLPAHKSNTGTFLHENQSLIPISRSKTPITGTKFRTNDGILVKIPYPLSHCNHSVLWLKVAS